MTTEPPSLVTVLRQLPYLTSEDSVYRAVEMLRHSGADTLPLVNAWGQLRGALTLKDLRPLLADGKGESAPLAPAARWARKPEVVGRAGMSADQARRALAESDETTLFIVDDEGRYLGAVTLADLLAPAPTPPRPASVGGMATPWGVYLTSGTLQAGVSNLALFITGLLIGLLLIFSHEGLGVLCWGAQKAFGWPVWTLWKAGLPARITWHNLDWFLLKGLMLPFFLLLLRLFPLTGYHAAEHQAVHAMERGEPLRPEVLRRMPRVHPRCGTNLLAGGLMFTAVSQALPALRIGLDAADSALLGAIVALFTWRSVGAFLQQHFTTRPATDRQLASGIAAAEELECKFISAMPRRPTLWRRLWCMGMPQTVLGVTLGSTVALFLFDFVFQCLK